MKKSSKKNLEQVAKYFCKNQVIDQQMKTTIKGGSHGVSTFDLVL